MFLVVLQTDTAVAETTRNSVQAEEMKAKAKAQAAQAIADDAQKDLAEALPALDAALASLRNLNKNDVTEVMERKEGTWEHKSDVNNAFLALLSTSDRVSNESPWITQTFQLPNCFVLSVAIGLQQLYSVLIFGH